MFCENCGSQVDDNAAVCTNCGAPIKQNAFNNSASNPVNVPMPKKFCKNCGSEMDPNAAICTKCGFAFGSGNAYCPSCGTATALGQAVCTNCGVALGSQSFQGAANPNAKSKLAAGLLGIFLGGWGIHNFYLGKTTRAIIQIVVTICTCGVGALWGLIEGILILAGSNGFTTDANGNPLKE